jgi:heme-degrading monooxygenase HmoA
MYSRVVTFTGAKNIDKGVTYVREEVLTNINAQHGFRGLTVSADRSGGVLGVLSLWDTEADRDASDSALAKNRREGLAIIGGEMTVENFEQLLAEISAQPVAGAPLMVTRVSMEPTKIEENFAFFRSEILPRIKAQPGFRSLRHMMSRQTGQGIVGAVWADQESMKSAAAEAQSRRQEGIDRGVRFGDVSYREIVFADLR